MGELTHFNEQGRARMVDVTEKAVTHRRAVAAGEIRVSPETMVHIKNGTMKKGDVLAVAQVAGIQAAKHNWELIPMCHPLPLTGIDITFHLSDQPCMVEIRAAVTCTGVTGVEMEALTAVSGGPHRLRYVQGGAEGHGDHQHPPAGKIRRQERRL